MNLKLHTTHSSFQNQLIQTISKSLEYFKPLLLGAALIFCSSSEGSLKIAVVDTGFCSTKAHVLSPHHKIHPAKDMTGTNGMDCTHISQKNLLESGRFHGQKVLNEFLRYLPKNRALDIYPLVVYDRMGIQSKAGWIKAISFIEKEKIDLVLTASGLITSKPLVSELPAIWFVPAGRTERLIDDKTALFPQMLAPKPNLFIIGDYFDGQQTIYDQALLYQEQIDYYFPSGRKNFSGTSRAVAQGMAQALDKCLIEKNLIAAHSLRLCLLKKEKILKDRILKREFKTF